ncbi:AAA family ATPase [Zhouia spongiae]|uniref:AAA family ATPase n=1 Tax=Zhouia spongiae TaxID=2202721 RepID=A0ABY3YJ72_9FLAO|nr:AAA family ATPase [Zhouia spongiae]UNY97745.1 AAA family ATPase [Zhouia spongiae]
MSQSLTEIARGLLASTKKEGKKQAKIQLIYAFNGTGKTRLSRKFKELIAPKNSEEDTGEQEASGIKIMYYNAFTEDLFYWDNDLPNDRERKLLVHSNGFTDLALGFLKDESQDGNIISNFQHYTTSKITPSFNDDFSEITFAYQGGGDNSEQNIKISKGEESNFIWCVFYSLIEHIVQLLKENEDERSSDKFNDLEYIFIDDPVSSLDDNHLIELAVDLATLIKNAKETNLKFIVSTHNPLFYNVLFNELNRVGNTRRYRFQKLNDGTYLLEDSKDSPFSYHVFLLDELKNVVSTRNLYKYHFNLLRNVLEKTSTYLGYNHWEDLIKLYVSAEEISVAIRLINLYSHSKFSGDEMSTIQESEKDIFIKVFNQFLLKHSFKLQLTESSGTETEIRQSEHATV